MGQTHESTGGHDSARQPFAPATVATPGVDPPADPTIVSLTIGPVHREVRVARLVAAGVAALAAFDLESTEDLRIAVDEACVWLIEHGGTAPLRLTFATSEPGRVRVTGETAAGAGTVDPSLTGLMAQIIAASCEQHSFDVADGVARFTLTAAAFEAAPTDRRWESDTGVSTS